VGFSIFNITAEGSTMKRKTINQPTTILFVFTVLFLLFNLGCSSTVYETIKSDPPEADIYWGKTSSDLAKSGHKTPYAKAIPESKLEPWCFQLQKDGYHKSDIYCRENELSWLVDYKLIPLETTITSEPPNASIYWGPTKDQVNMTEYVTPHIESDVYLGASWKNWHFQVNKDGYNDSAIVFKPKIESDRHVHFVLIPKKEKNGAKEVIISEFISSKNQVVLAWDYDMDSDILGFEIERRRNSEGQFRKIAIVGPNVTNYKDTELTPGATYYYRIRAFNSREKSSYTDVIKVKIVDNN
jgi:hypothetical protein